MRKRRNQKEKKKERKIIAANSIVGLLGSKTNYYTYQVQDFTLRMLEALSS